MGFRIIIDGKELPIDIDIDEETREVTVRVKNYAYTRAYTKLEIRGIKKLLEHIKNTSCICQVIKKY